MITIYGIKSCDTVRKAKKCLDDAGHDYQYIDFRIQGIAQQKLHHWSKKLGWEKLLNTRSTSWRQLNAQQKQDITETSAIKLMLENPTLIKRPVLESNDLILVGFQQAEYQQLS